MPTRSAALLILLAVILELLGRLISSTGVTIAAAAALGAVLGDAALMPRVGGISLGRRSLKRMTVGIPTTVRLTATAPARRTGARRSLVIVDPDPALSPSRTVTPRLAAGERAVASHERTPTRRGYWTEDYRVVLEAYSPLGGFVSRRSFVISRTCWVRPAPAQPFRLPAADRGQPTGTAASHQSGAGTEFYGIREWRSGDSTSAIHWRASARRSQLLVMERERPAHSALLVVAGPAPDNTERWEVAIARAAATAVAAKRSGYAVTLLAGGAPVTPRSSRDVLDWFAELTSAPEPGQSAVAAALRSTGQGATTLWLAAAPPSAATVALARPGAILHCLAPDLPGRP